MKIQTERLVLRPLVLDDARDLLRIYNDEETCKYLGFDLWNEENYLENFNVKLANNSLAEKGKLSIAVDLDGVVIGDLLITNTGVRETVEIGYTFSPEYRGNNYAFESLNALISTLFKDYKMHRIQASVDTRNIASSKLCEKLGMRLEGHFLSDYWNNGEWADSYYYGILNSEFKI